MQFNEAATKPVSKTERPTTPPFGSGCARMTRWRHGDADAIDGRLNRCAVGRLTLMTEHFIHFSVSCVLEAYVIRNSAVVISADLDRLVSF